MPNLITNTAIVNESWNGRGLITHQAVTKALVRADDGVLWAAVREAHPLQFINIYRSGDGGFSWQNMWASDFTEIQRRTGIAGLNQNGPFMHLALSEERNRLILFHTYYDISTLKYNVEPFYFTIGAGGALTRLTTSPGATSLVTEADELALDVSYTSNHVWLTFVHTSVLKVLGFDLSVLALDGTGSVGTTYFNIFGTHANDNNTMDIGILCNEGATYALKYLRWTRITNAFTTPVIVHSFPVADIADVNVERDGSDNILIMWNQETPTGSSITQKYAISTDNGVTWTVSDVPFTPGQISFNDLITGRLAGRCVTLGGLQGFLLGYVRLIDGKPYGFIRTLLKEGATYVLGDEKRAVDIPITGFRFFRPSNNQLVDLDQLGQVRIAYQVGYTTSTVQQDYTPVYFGQQLLQEAAAFQNTETSYIDDVPTSSQVLVSFTLAGALDENIDYYAVGVIGNTTHKYIAAFNKIGSNLSFYRYEPTAAAESSDRSAYGNPSIYIARCVVDPSSYSFPLATGNESFTTMVERDQRTLYLSPSLHLGRTFLVNAGNHLKRTVWLLRFDGNEYEISQVVPRFIKDQLVYYEANAYVVGPSNDPFSRTILPSET